MTATQEDMNCQKSFSILLMWPTCDQTTSPVYRAKLLPPLLTSSAMMEIQCFKLFSTLSLWNQMIATADPSAASSFLLRQWNDSQRSKFLEKQTHLHSSQWPVGRATEDLAIAIVNGTESRGRQQVNSTKIPRLELVRDMDLVET